MKHKKILGLRCLQKWTPGEEGVIGKLTLEQHISPKKIAVGT